MLHKIGLLKTNKEVKCFGRGLQSIITSINQVAIGL